MKKVIIEWLRKLAPLKLRQNIGPYIGYADYFININFRKKRPTPRVMTLDETLNIVIENEMSVVRFGDGEMSLMDNCDLAFQNKNDELASKLKTILRTSHDKSCDKLLICIPGIWGRLEIFIKRDFWFDIHHLFRHGDSWRNLISYDYFYGNTFITRAYLMFKDKSNSGHVFEQLFSIWKDKDVVLIEGEKSRLGVGNDMFDKTKSFGRILCPPENAYSKYQDILKEAMKVDKNKLILVSLGPTAKVLTYDLFKLGYRVIDIGHIDMEYEMYLRGEGEIKKIQFKYFNEINERNPEECNDEKYLQQIIAVIK